jgi:hypothetical protein
MKSGSILFCLGVALSLFSCTKELSQEAPVQISSSSGDFYATIDGQYWQGDSIRQAVVAGGTLTITGVGKTGDALAIILPDLQTGVYELNGQSAGYALFTNLGDTTNLYLSNGIADSSKAGGVVNLTSVDTVHKTVSGTFQFNLYQESGATVKVVTAGVFNNISYGGGGVVTPPDQQPGTGNKDTLLAKVDNAGWTAAQVVIDVENNLLVIAGISGQQTLAVYMPVNITAGTYPLQFSSGQYFAAFNPDTQTSLLSVDDGTLTILEHDTVKKHIRGNFSFTGKSITDSSSAGISDGYFSVNY